MIKSVTICLQTYFSLFYCISQLKISCLSRLFFPQLSQWIRMLLYERNLDNLSRGRGKGLVGPLQEIPESLVGEWLECGGLVGVKWLQWSSCGGEVGVIVVVIVDYGSKGVLINCCIRHCRIGNCRTGEDCIRSVGFWSSRVIFCGFGNPGFWQLQQLKLWEEHIWERVEQQLGLEQDGKV